MPKNPQNSPFLLGQYHTDPISRFATIHTVDRPTDRPTDRPMVHANVPYNISAYAHYIESDVLINVAYCIYPLLVSAQNSKLISRVAAI